MENKFPKMQIADLTQIRIVPEPEPEPETQEQKSLLGLDIDKLFRDNPIPQSGAIN